MKSLPDPSTHTVAIEQIERDAWFDLYVAAPDDLKAPGPVSVARLGETLLLADRSTPATVVNRALCLGVGQPASEAQVGDAVAWMRSHANPNWSLQIVPVANGPEMQAWAQAQGLRRLPAELAKFYREPTPPADPRTLSRLDIREVGPDNAADFGRVAQTGYPLPPHFAPWLSALVGRPGWRCYLAYDGALPVACAAMFVQEGWAWLGVDATLADHRGRGAQKALIARRLADGIAAGVDGFTVETGLPAAGTEAKHPSFRNISGAGFALAYARMQYGPA
jgi:hypothetical protein